MDLVNRFFYLKVRYLRKFSFPEPGQSGQGNAGGWPSTTGINPVKVGVMTMYVIVNEAVV